MELCQKAPGRRAGSRRRSSGACTDAARSSWWPCSASRTYMRARLRSRSPLMLGCAGHVGLPSHRVTVIS